MIKAVDIFSGAGGMSLGAINAGIKVELAVEADKHAAYTYAHNHPGTNIFADDIRKLGIKDLKISGDKTILFGGPPCQGFSTSNQKTRSKENKDNWLFMEFVRIAKLWKPDWFIFENVSGLVETGKGFFLKKIMDHFEKAGFHCVYWVLNSVDFGVPQKRKRLFIIGSRHGITLEKPLATTERRIIVQEAISDLPNLKNGASLSWMSYKKKALTEYVKMMRNGAKKSPNHLVTKNSPLVLERYKYVPQGGNWENIPPELMENYKDYSRCHTGIYHRLHDSKPSVVLGNYRKNMLIHPTQHRGLSVREAARLQSFPDWYEFKGSIGFQQQQVGNAVPPLLAESVFKSVIAASQR
jgi:DNA (cytosine-5)-methyltransferase 1